MHSLITPNLTYLKLIFFYLVPNNPKQNREHTIQIFFETFNVPMFYIAVQPVLALYASGRTSGIVLDSGNQFTHSVSINQGFALSKSIISNKFAGRDLNKQTSKYLKNLPFTQYVQLQNARKIKENMCYVTVNPEQQQNNNKQYQLPCGTKITLGSERWVIPQALFDGKSVTSVQDTIFNSLNNSDQNLRKTLLNNIVLSGGNTLFNNFESRLQAQIFKSKLIPQNLHSSVQIYASKNRDEQVWRGASILTSMQSFKQKWIKREEYDQVGPSIVHEKCI